MGKRANRRAVIRPLEPDDGDALGDLLVQLGGDPDAAHFHPYPMTRAQAHLIAEGSPSRRDLYFGAFIEGQLVGYGQLRGWDEGYAIPAFGVAVARGYRGQGIGRALLRHAIELAHARDCQTMMLKVHSANASARTLYQSEGFRFALLPDESGQIRGTLDL